MKLLGVGELTSKLSFEVTRASKSAVEAVEKAGGSVSVVYASRRLDPRQGRGDRG